jgi:hypothetical protein
MILSTFFKLSRVLNSTLIEEWSWFWYPFRVNQHNYIGKVIISHICLLACFWKFTPEIAWPYSGLSSYDSMYSIFHRNLTAFLVWIVTLLSPFHFQSRVHWEQAYQGSGYDFKVLNTNIRVQSFLKCI